MKHYPMILCILMFCCLGLLACSSTPPPPVQVVNKPVDVSVQDYIKHHPEVLQNLQASHIQLLQLGDYDRFVLPSSLLFNGMGHRLQGASYPILDQLIDMIKTVPKESITIQAYTAETHSKDIAVKLTALQAQAVADYFMSHGIDVRLIYSIGMGSSQQVTESPDRLLENCRVEITLERDYQVRVQISYSLFCLRKRIPQGDFFE
jgi:outer membrane protein OmpA-like peptidoglycan-associated protein